MPKPEEIVDADLDVIADLAKSPKPLPKSKPRRHPSARVGQLLVERGAITPAQLTDVLQKQKLTGDRIGTVLLSMGLVPEDTLAELLAEQNGVPCVNLETTEPEKSAITLVPKKLALRTQALPLARRGGTLDVAIMDPSNVSALDELKFATGLHINVFVAPESQIRLTIQKWYSSDVIGNIFALPDLPEADLDEGSVEVLDDEKDTLDVSTLESMSGDDRVVQLVNYIIVDAVSQKASDIHLEVYDKEFRVRFRIDGELVTVMAPPWKLREALCSRIKIMSSLNITERRLPQDGRIRMNLRFENGVKEMDFRVSTLPTVFGEKIVMRLLDKANLQFEMGSLGLEPESLVHFQRAIQEPYGLILVTGPTGSGKTNTLYSAISQLNEPGTNIMTAEDPVEYTIKGVNQVAVNDRVGLTFSAAVRSFLRQDPDIILIGEMRDSETAEMGIKAALTGHLVLSTLHTNSAPAAVDRLVNMDIDPFLIASSLQLVCAQRLVRRLCSHCKKLTPAGHDLMRDAGFSDDELESIEVFKAEGCDKCRHSGYKGRVGLFEVMPMSDEIREMILSRKTLLDLRMVARRNGMMTMRESGLRKIREGVTSLEEVLAETAL